MSDEVGNGAGAHAELLEAITNLSRYHREHEKFYASAPREQALLLQRHARALLALADRWNVADVQHRSPFSPFEGAPDLNAAVATQLDGVLFMEGEGEPPELVHLKRDLRTLADDAAAIGEWLAAAMQASWAMAESLLDVDELRAVLGERHRIIANDWQASGLSALAARLVDRAVDILDRIDFSPGALRADLEGPRASPERLYSAAEIINHAADLLSESAGLDNDNERRWRTFRAAVQRAIDSR
jgi:hypothetical protein